MNIIGRLLAHVSSQPAPNPSLFTDQVSRWHILDAKGHSRHQGVEQASGLGHRDASKWLRQEWYRGCVMGRNPVLIILILKHETRRILKNSSTIQDLDKS